MTKHQDPEDLPPAPSHADREDGAHLPIPPLESLGVIQFFLALRVFHCRRADNPFLSDGFVEKDRRQHLRHLPLVATVIMVGATLVDMLLPERMRGFSFVISLPTIFGAAFFLPPLGMILFGRRIGDVHQQEELLLTRTTTDEWAFGAVYPAIRWAVRWQVLIGAIVITVSIIWMIIELSRNTYRSTPEAMEIAIFLDLVILYVGTAAVTNLTCAVLWTRKFPIRWLFIIVAPLEGLLQLIPALFMFGCVTVALWDFMPGGGSSREAVAWSLAVFVSFAYAVLWHLLVPWWRMRLAGARLFRAVAPERLEENSWFAGSRRAAVLLRDGLPSARPIALWRGWVPAARKTMFLTLALCATAGAVGTLLVGDWEKPYYWPDGPGHITGPPAVLLRAVATPFGAFTTPSLFVALFLYFRGGGARQEPIPAIVGRPVRTLAGTIVPVVSVYCCMVLPMLILDHSPLLAITGVAPVLMTKVFPALLLVAAITALLSLAVMSVMLPRRGRRVLTIAGASLWWIIATGMAALLRAPRFELQEIIRLDIDSSLSDGAAFLLSAMGFLALLAVYYAVPYFLDRWQSEEFTGLVPGTLTTDQPTMAEER